MMEQKCLLIFSFEEGTANLPIFVLQKENHARCGYSSLKMLLSYQGTSCALGYRPLLLKANMVSNYEFRT